jgi:hypothetical protein
MKLYIIVAVSRERYLAPRDINIQVIRGTREYVNDKAREISSLSKWKGWNIVARPILDPIIYAQPVRKNKEKQSDK